MDIAHTNIELSRMKKYTTEKQHYFLHSETNINYIVHQSVQTRGFNCLL